MDHATHQQHQEPSATVASRGHTHGHDRHAGHSVAMFRDKFWLSLALTVPVILLSHDVEEWFGYTIPMIPGIEYVPAILARSSSSTADWSSSVEPRASWPIASPG